MKKLVILLIIVFLVFIFSAYNPLELKLKSGLQVTTGEISSSLFLDDQYLDKAPFIDKQIKPNNYTLRIEPDDSSLSSYELPITLNKGMVTVVIWNPGETLESSGGVIYEMEKLKRGEKAQIDFQTIPDGAILTFDGGAKQFSPLLLTNLEEGSHSFEVSLPSYETQQHSISLIKNHKVTVTVILAKTGDVPQVTPDEAIIDELVATSSATPELSGPQIQILKTNFFVNDQEVLRVRDAASPAGKELGFATVGKSYPYLDEKESWFEIDFDGQRGWVSAQFSQKIDTESPEDN